MNQEKDTSVLDNLSNITNVMNLTKVQRSIWVKMLVAVVISLLISSMISTYITSYVKTLIGGSFGVSINTIVSLLVSTTIITLFVKFLIINPLNRVIQVIRKAAEGDLTVKISYQSKDEIGQLSDAFNFMITNLRDLVDKTSKAAEQVSAYSEELNVSVEQNSKTIEQISASIQELAVGSETQSKDASQLSEANQEVSQGAEKLALSIHSVAESSNVADKKAIAGIELASETVEQMNLIQESVKETAKTVNALGGKSKEIGDIVGIITQIADQTNLLALNAAIEAARAGEHGKGFAVVANEVRKLAEESSRAAGNIGEIIKGIQLDTDTAVHSMTSEIDIVEKGILMVNKTGESFNDIIQSVHTISSQIQQVSAIFDEQVGRNSSNMKRIIEDIVAITEQAAGNTQQIASAIEEQNASIEEIASSSALLNKMSRELKEDVNAFKIE